MVVMCNGSSSRNGTSVGEVGERFCPSTKPLLEHRGEDLGCERENFGGDKKMYRVIVCADLEGHIATLVDDYLRGRVFGELGHVAGGAASGAAGCEH
jgi:hypothetical protein